MKIVADEKIPLVQHYFGSQHELILKNGRDLQKKDVINADLLIVRSVTKVNADLLENTKVQWVGSVTTGSDHLDIAWLQKAGISYYVAAGCNATAVVEYVLCVIARLQKNKLLNHARAGVIGCGRIGNQVINMLEILGFEVLQCDPYRAYQEKDFPHVPLQALHDLDLVLLHTPLTKDGEFPTYHMINTEFLSRQKENCILISAGRGAVVDFNDLSFNTKNIWCLDVWENEPLINLNILNHAFIATPHVAGHSIQSKYRAIEMVYHAALQQGWIQHSVAKIPFPTKHIDLHHQKCDWREVVLSVYDPMQTSLLMKEKMQADPTAFDSLRNAFNKNEFASVTFRRLNVTEADFQLLKKIGFIF